jgi:superfamily II DNA helicase RecQ
MPLRFFTIPARDSDLSEQELNRFLAGHKVVSIERQLVDAGMNSFWAICVDYLNSSSTQSGRPTDVARNRVDYKTILSPEEFTIFSQLREFRKETAQTEAVPVYALFTNEQLALMVQRRCQSKTDLLGIDGIGDAKIEKYADRLLKILSKMPEASDAADSESV